MRAAKVGGHHYFDGPPGISPGGGDFIDARNIWNRPARGRVPRQEMRVYQ
jgi:hypothetical protein